MHAEERFQAARVTTLLRKKNTVTVNYESIACTEVVEYNNQILKRSLRAISRNIAPLCLAVKTYAVLFQNPVIVKFTTFFLSKTATMSAL